MPQTDQNADQNPAQPPTLGNGVIYTPETLIGDEDVTVTPPTLIRFDATTPTPEEYATYTVRFDKKVNRKNDTDPDFEGLAPADNTTEPASVPASPVKGALFTVRLFILNDDGSTTAINRNWYTITGLNGVQQGRRRATFDLEFTNNFTFPVGKDSINVQMLVKRKNTDASGTVRVKTLLIRVHKPGL